MPGNSTEGFFTILARITQFRFWRLPMVTEPSMEIEDLPHPGRFRDDRSLKIPTIRLGLGSRTDYFSIQLA